MGSDLQKRKGSSPVWLHLLCHFRPKNDTKRAAKQVMTFFFFFFGEAGPLPQKTGLELNLSVPILLKKKIISPYIWSREKWPSIVPIFAFPNMVTLVLQRVRKFIEMSKI